MSSGWSIYVIVLTMATIVGCGWLLFVNRKARMGAVFQQSRQNKLGFGASIIQCNAQ